MSSNRLFRTFPVNAIRQWADALDAGELSCGDISAAVEAGLITEINGTFYAYPGHHEDAAEWAARVGRLTRRGIVVGGKSDPAPESEPKVVMEFGGGLVFAGAVAAQHLAASPTIPGVTATASPRESSDTPEEPLVAETAPTPDAVPASTEPAPAIEQPEEAPWEPSPEPEPVQEKPKDDLLRARISALPTYFAVLKEPLNKLVDAGADELVISTALDLAGKPYHLGQLAAYARFISLNLEQFDHMTLIQNAHKSGIRVANTSDANARVLAEVMERVPDNRKNAVKATFEKHITEGLDKYWAEAWAQTEAAVAAGRVDRPFNFFIHIINDMKKNSEHAENRGGATIQSFSEIRWIMDYLPKNEQLELPEGCGFERGTRKFYVPRMKEAIERAGHIDLSWVLSIMVDNEYPTRFMTGPLSILAEKFPALSNIVTREQFEYALQQLAIVLVDRAKRCRESWNPKYTANFGSTFIHHAVFNGHQYLLNLKGYLDQDMKFMQPVKDDLLALLADTDTRALLEFWWFNQNPWSHGDTPEAAHAHRQEEIAYDVRAAAAEERRQAELGECEAPKSNLLPFPNL